MSQSTENVIAAADREPQIVVLLDGGRVDTVLSSHPMRVLVLDYDTEGADDEEIAMIPQTSLNRSREGRLSEIDITVEPGDVTTLYHTHDQGNPS